MQKLPNGFSSTPSETKKTKETLNLPRTRLSCNLGSFKDIQISHYLSKILCSYFNLFSKELHIYAAIWRIPSSLISFLSFSLRRILLQNHLSSSCPSSSTSSPPAQVFAPLLSSLPPLTHYLPLSFAEEGSQLRRSLQFAFALDLFWNSSCLCEV